MSFERSKPKPEYLKRVRSLTDSEKFALKMHATEDEMDLYVGGVWTKDEMLAVILEWQEKHSEPSTPPTSS